MYTKKDLTIIEGENTYYMTLETENFRVHHSYDKQKGTESELTQTFLSHCNGIEFIGKPISQSNICPKAAQCAHRPGGMRCPDNVICPI